MFRTGLISIFIFMAMVLTPLLASAGVVDIGVAGDAQVVEGYASSNYASKTSMYVASASGGSYQDERVWTSFKLEDELPPGATITSATLRLFCYKADDDTNLLTSVHGVSDDTTWTESAITWSNQPSYGAELTQVELNPGMKGEWIEWDVTSFVQSEYSTDQIVSLVVKATTEGSGNWTSYAFDGREYSSSLTPRLRVEYTGDWPTSETIKILHMNDVHSRLHTHDLDIPEKNDTPVFEEVGGAAYFATKLLELKGQNPDALIMDAGDVFEGGPVGDLRGNGAMVEVFNKLDEKLKGLGGRGIDAVVVGNHDVRYLEYINNLKIEATFPVISMNITHAGTTTPYFDPYVIVDVDGKRVGVLGYTNDSSTYMAADSDAEIDILTAVWEDTDSSTVNIKDYVRTLRETEGCDVVVLLSHMGHTRVVAGDDALVADHGGVRPPDVVVAGHWHTMTETAWKPAHLNGKTLIVEAASYMQYLGELEITTDGEFVQAQKHSIQAATITPDADVANLVATLSAEFEATSPYQLNQVIGYSAVNLSLDKDKWWTINEYPWSGDNAAGAWIADAMVWKAAQLGHSGDIALQSGGGVRRDVKAGPITYEEIYETYPWQDDGMVLVQLTGQELWDFIEDDYCGTSLSAGWLVTAEDGIISSMTYQGTPISLSGTYNVLVSSYMSLHETAFSGKTATSVTDSIRQGVIDYTGQFTEASPMQVPGPRYDLDTELAGGFNAVVTMTADAESQPYYEAVFVRLLSATPETVARRDSYGLSGLVNADGSINPDHQFAESMLYRSHLGFADGELQPGDIIEIWVEGGFHDGNPQLIDQKGIVDRDNEMLVLGHDETLAQPVSYGAVNDFWDEQHENYFVSFYAEKTGDSSVRDADGTQISTYKPGGYYSEPLPGNVGDILKLTGVSTYDENRRIFRTSSVSIAATTGYPPISTVDQISPAVQSTSPLFLSATASDPVSSGTSVLSVAPQADAQVVEGYPTSNYGTRSYLYVQTASSGYKNERAWLKFDLSGVPSGATISSATLKLYNWRYGSSGLPVAVHAGDNNWTETGITWNSAPSFAATALDTQTIDTDDTWYSWDLTSYVQGQLGASQTEMSFVMKAVSEGASTALSYAFESKEWSDSSLRPVLEIEYDGATTGGSVDTVTFNYRYSADGLSWTNWGLAGEDSAEPWNLSFAYPNGHGYYQFYSVASDNDGNVEEAPGLADAQVRYVSANQSPSVPTSPGIADGSVDVGLSPELSVAVSDPDGDTLDVSFYAVTGSGDQLIGTVSGVTSGQRASYVWSGLSADTEYQWYAVASDGNSTSVSSTWSFTTLSTSVPAVPAIHPGILLGIALLLSAGMIIRRRNA